MEKRLERLKILGIEIRNSFFCLSYDVGLKKLPFKKKKNHKKPKIVYEKPHVP